MATLTIDSWELTPFNPNGSINSFLPALTGSVPTNEQVDFTAMGQLFKLVLFCKLTGDLTDPATTPAEVSGTLIRYNPGFFVDFNSQFTPIGSVPSGGYSFTPPNNSPGVFNMPLMGQLENLNSNTNGSVEIAIIDATNFTITHVFRVTSDLETYLIGKVNQNQYRLSKASQFSTLEGDISRPSVFGWDKALNAFVATRHLDRYVLLARELSLQFSASFDGIDSSGIISDYVPTYRVERVAAPGVEESSLSPFEDNLLIVDFVDPSGDIVVDEAEAILVSRANTHNIADYERDFDLAAAKLITSGGSAQLDGAIYEPVTYANALGVTRISFVIKGSLLRKDSNYQVHVTIGLPDTVSANKMQHTMSGMLRTDGAPQEVDFDMSVNTWTRNGNHAEEFTITAGERATSVLSMNKDQYDANAAAPFTTFDDDIDTVRVIILGDNAEIIFQEFIQKQADGSWIDTEHIGIIQTTATPSEDAMFYAYLKEFRVPYANEQGLDDWTDTDKVIRWTARFMDQTDPTFGAVYEFNSKLHVRGYENNEPSPSADAITNIRFLDPVTGLPISNWCETNEILVVADVEPFADEIYMVAMVDKFPLGAAMYNDFALEEEDGQMHTLPDYVIFSEKLSGKISELTIQPEADGTVSFVLDISSLTDEEKMRIYFLAYRLVV